MNTRYSIQTGHGLDRAAFPEEWKGSEAKRLWNESEFKYGMEYGYLLAIAERGLDDVLALAPLSGREREILQTWIDLWDANDAPLAGDIGYCDAETLIKRMGLKVPRVVADICSGDFVRRMREVKK